MKRKLKKAYQRLDKEEYKGIIKDTMMFCDEYDGEFITMLTPDTILTIEKHFYNDKFMGYNVKADGKLLETKESKKKARKFIKEFIKKQPYQRPNF